MICVALAQPDWLILMPLTLIHLTDFFNFWKIWNKIQQIDDLLLEHKENEPHQMIYAVPVIGGRTSEAESIYRIIPVSLCFFFLKNNENIP